jgi:hypothetical protein
MEIERQPSRSRSHRLRNGFLIMLLLIALLLVVGLWPGPVHPVR